MLFSPVGLTLRDKYNESLSAGIGWLRGRVKIGV